MWLSPEFLKWDTYPEYELSDQNYRRAYDMWSHADQVLRQFQDDFHRVDALSTLKRALSHRLQLLKDLHKLDAIPLSRKPKRTIEQLEFFGVVRPTMLIQLIDVRNAIEHEDAPPPPYKRCLELLDFVWYFLRSTDRLATRLITDIYFHQPRAKDYDTGYFVTIETGPQNAWQMNFVASVNSSLLREDKENDWFQVRIDSLETRDEVRSRISHEDSNALEDRRSKDLYIKGTIIGPENNLKEIVDMYFDIALSIYM